MGAGALRSLGRARVQGAGISEEQAAEVLQGLQAALQDEEGAADPAQVVGGRRRGRARGRRRVGRQVGVTRRPAPLLPRAQLWRRVSKDVLRPEHPFALHDLLFAATFEGWDADADGPPPVWVPTPEGAAATNAARFMREWRGDATWEQLRTGDPCRDWDLLQRCSFASPEAFWPAVLRRLGIRFHAPPHRWGGGGWGCVVGCPSCWASAVSACPPQMCSPACPAALALARAGRWPPTPSTPTAVAGCPARA